MLTVSQVSVLPLSLRYVTLYGEGFPDMRNSDSDKVVCWPGALLCGCCATDTGKRYGLYYCCVRVLVLNGLD